MRFYFSKIILILGILLTLASFVAYGMQSGKFTRIPSGASGEETARLTQELGLDDPLAIQYSLFLLLFVPGMILLGAFGTYGLPRSAAPIGLIARLFIMVILLMNMVTVLLDLMQAPRQDGLFSAYWWLMMIVSALALVNFVSVLGIWNGQKWGILGLGLGSGAMLVLNIIGGEPFFTALFAFSIVPILFWLIWPVIWQMD